MGQVLTWCFVGLLQCPTRDYKREAIFSDVGLRSSIHPLKWNYCLLIHWNHVTSEIIEKNSFSPFHQAESLLKPTFTKNKCEQNNMTRSQLWKNTRLEIGSWYNFREKKLERSGNCQSHGMGHIVIWKNDPNRTIVPVHFPESGSIQVHQSQMHPCPPKWPTSFYWYGGHKLSRGGVPNWLEKLLSCGSTN